MKHPVIVVLAALVTLTLAPVIADMALAQEAPPPSPLPPQMGCTPATQLFAGLEQIGEMPAVIGVGPRGSTGILARNPTTSSWTFVLVNEQGCLMFSIGGDHSATFDHKPGEPS